MHLEWLSVKNFRNYREQKINFNKQVNVILGDNGQGKTNLIEAVELLLQGSSFRNPPTENLVFKENTENLTKLSFKTVIEGDVHSEQGKNRLKFQIEDFRKSSLLNEKKISKTILKEKFQAFSFSPDSLSVIKEGPMERRNLADEILLSLDGRLSQTLGDFQKVLKNKNKQLKLMLDVERQSEENEALLSSLNEIFLPLAVRVTYSRIKALRSVVSEVQNIMENVLGFEKLEISVDYMISDQSAIDWDENQVYYALKSRLGELSLSERASGQCLVGPQKHDVRFLYQGQDSRHFCSQGQQRALILAFKIASVRRFYKQHSYFPVLLLDDVMSELDEGRRRSLHRVLKEVQAQIFITTIENFDLHEFKDKSLNVFKVKNGFIEKQEVLL